MGKSIAWSLLNHLTSYPFISVKLILSNTDYSNCILALVKPNYYFMSCRTPLLFPGNVSPFCLAVFTGSSLLMNSKSWKKPTKSLKWPLLHWKKICGLINTLGCVIIHYSVLQLVNTWHGEGEMAVCFPSVLMLISNRHQRPHLLEKIKIILPNITR